MYRIAGKSSFHTLLAAVGAFFATSALSDASNSDAGADAEKPADARLVILGDSITAGYGIDQAAAYPSLLQEQFNKLSIPLTVVNAGVSGDTSAGGRSRILWAMGDDKVDALIIALGGNDGLRGIMPNQTKTNLLAIINQAREHSPDVHIIVAGMEMPDNMGEAYKKEFAEIFPTVAEKADAALLPFLLKDVAGIPRYNLEDQIHPNEEGQEIVMQTIWQTLLPWLKERKLLDK